MGKLKLSNLAETLIASEIVRLGAAIKEKIRLGDHIYNYTIGDFDSSQFPIPRLLQEEIIRAYKEGKTTYPAAEGELELRKSVSDFIAKYQAVLYSPQEILISAGGRPLIYAVYRTIVDKGDKVIYPCQAGTTIIIFILQKVNTLLLNQAKKIILCQRLRK
jgi:aspartate aminotransferase